MVTKVANQGVRAPEAPAGAIAAYLLESSDTILSEISRGFILNSNQYNFPLKKHNSFNNISKPH